MSAFSPPAANRCGLKANGRRRMVTPPGFAAPAGPGGCRACSSLPETHRRWFRLYRVAEPRRFTRDEHQFPRDFGGDAKPIRGGVMMARIGWVELREERLGAHLRNFRAARVERIAVPEVYFEVRSNARVYLGLGGQETG